MPLPTAAPSALDAYKAAKRAAAKAAKAAKVLDKEIEAIYYAHFSGVQLNIMDIPKVFKAGHAAAAVGGNVQDAVVAAVAALRLN
jgi:hypothetical protein